MKNFREDFSKLLTRLGPTRCSGSGYQTVWGKALLMADIIVLWHFSLPNQCLSGITIWDLAVRNGICHLALNLALYWNNFYKYEIVKEIVFLIAGRNMSKLNWTIWHFLLPNKCLSGITILDLAVRNGIWDLALNLSLYWTESLKCYKFIQ